MHRIINSLLLFWFSLRLTIHSAKILLFYKKMLFIKCLSSLSIKGSEFSFSMFFHNNNSEIEVKLREWQGQSESESLHG